MCRYKRNKLFFNGSAERFKCLCWICIIAAKISCIQFVLEWKSGSGIKLLSMLKSWRKIRSNESINLKCLAPSKYWFISDFNWLHTQTILNDQLDLIKFISRLSKTFISFQKKVIKIMRTHYKIFGPMHLNFNSNSICWAMNG